MGADVATGPDTLVARLLAALLDADRVAVEAAVDTAVAELRDGVAVLDGVIAPVMREIGRLWEAGAISIADEHLATAIAHGTLTRIYPALVVAPPRSRGVVLLAGADGEEHVLGLRMVADVLAGSGFDVRNVGGALPADALTSAIVRHRPVLVGLADTMGDGASLRRSIEAVRTLDGRLPILLGGPGATTLAGLDERVVVCVSARSAREHADRLLPVV